MCYNSYIQFKEIHTCGSRPLEKPCLASVSALIKTGFFYFHATFIQPPF